MSNGGSRNPKLTLKINSLWIKMKGQNFSSQVLSRHTFRILRKKGSDFFDHRSTLREKDDKNASKPVARHSKPTHGSLRPLLTSRKNGKQQNSRTKIYVSNRHSQSSRYERTLFIQLIYPQAAVFHVARHQPIA